MMNELLNIKTISRIIDTMTNESEDVFAVSDAVDGFLTTFKLANLDVTDNRSLVNMYAQGIFNTIKAETAEALGLCEPIDIPTILKLFKELRHCYVHCLLKAGVTAYTETGNYPAELRTKMAEANVDVSIFPQWLQHCYDSDREFTVNLISLGLPHDISLLVDKCENDTVLLAVIANSEVLDFGILHDLETIGVEDLKGAIK